MQQLLTCSTAKLKRIALVIKIVDLVVELLYGLLCQKDGTEVDDLINCSRVDGNHNNGYKTKMETSSNYSGKLIMVI